MRFGGWSAVVIVGRLPRICDGSQVVVRAVPLRDGGYFFAIGEQFSGGHERPGACIPFVAELGFDIVKEGSAKTVTFKRRIDGRIAVHRKTIAVGQQVQNVEAVVVFDDGAFVDVLPRRAPFDWRGSFPARPSKPFASATKPQSRFSLRGSILEDPLVRRIVEADARSGKRGVRWL